MTVDGKILGHCWGKLPGYKHESDLFETIAASFSIGLGWWTQPQCSAESLDLRSRIS